MLNALIFAAAALGVSPAPGPGVSPAGIAPVVVAAPISPTCTLDPFSGRSTCTNAPACFYDPLTGRHYCPEGRGAGRLRG